jgi:hypothetical protein
MGYTIRFHCPSCHYTFDAFLGIGMLFWSLRNVLSSLSPSRRKTVSKILDELGTDGDHGDENFFYENAVFRCPATGLYYNRFYVKILSPDDGSVLYETRYRCPKSKVMMDLVMSDEEIKERPCPGCGDVGIEGEVSEMWD